MAVNLSGRNIPVPTADTAEYWSACARHELVLQHCQNCGHYQFYPRALCTQCQHSELSWRACSGTGEIQAFSIVRRPIAAAYREEAPYAIALIRLDEGPTMMSNIVATPLETLRVGLRVSVVFEQWTEDITVPKFKSLG